MQEQLLIAQNYLKPNEKMTTTVLPQSLNRIHTIASKAGMIPFFFVRNQQQSALPVTQKFTLKVNREMAPFSNMTSNVRLGFWNVSQFENLALTKKTLENSLILNPYKTQRLVSSALTKGIAKMLVSDIQEMAKIQQSYFQLAKNGHKVIEPSYIWQVENYNCDLENVNNLQKCGLPLHGLYFTADMNYQEIKKFLNQKNIKNQELLKFRETTVQEVQEETELMAENNLQPVILNYSDTDKFDMVCRVLGKDKQGRPVFDNECLNFICKNETCACSGPSPKIKQTFKASGHEWAVLRSARLDKLEDSLIYE